MKAGPELDQLIATKIMNAEQVHGHFVDSIDQETKTISTKLRLYLPQYSTSISLAFQVVEKVRSGSRLYDFELWVHGDGEATASFVLDKTYTAYGESVPEAICKAALLTVGENK